MMGDGWGFSKRRSIVPVRMSRETDFSDDDSDEIPVVYLKLYLCFAANSF